MAGRFVSNVDQAKSQDNGSILWAFATNTFFVKCLICAAGDEAVRKLPTVKLQELSNTAWAFGKAGLQRHAFFAAIEEVLRRRENAGGAKAGKKGRPALWLGPAGAVGKGGSELPSALLQLEPQSLANILWAVAKLHQTEDHASREAE